jgi:hypothetical protein
MLWFARLGLRQFFLFSLFFRFSLAFLFFRPLFFVVVAVKMSFSAILLIFEKEKKSPNWREMM